MTMVQESGDSSAIRWNVPGLAWSLWPCMTWKTIHANRADASWIGIACSDRCGNSYPGWWNDVGIVLFADENPFGISNAVEPRIAMRILRSERQTTDRGIVHYQVLCVLLVVQMQQVKHFNSETFFINGRNHFKYCYCDFSYKFTMVL